MTRTVATKMGIKENSKAYFVNSDKNAIDSIHLPALYISAKLEEEFDYIHLFVKKESEFIELFPKLREHLKTSGMLWVSWPKGRKLGNTFRMFDCSKVAKRFFPVKKTYRH